MKNFLRYWLRAYQKFFLTTWYTLLVILFYSYNQCSICQRLSSSSATFHANQLNYFNSRNSLSTICIWPVSETWSSSKKLQLHQKTQAMKLRIGLANRRRRPRPLINILWSILWFSIWHPSLGRHRILVQLQRFAGNLLFWNWPYLS